MALPDYHHNSIVNLMSSILTGLGVKSDHPDLKDLTAEIKNAVNVILLVIDGMGSSSLSQLQKNSFLLNHKSKDLTSVFPSTTTSAITTFMTGQSPQEHGLLAWYMYFNEVDEVAKILPYKTRDNQPLKVGPKKLLLPKGIFSQIKAETHLVMDRILFKSKYNVSLARNMPLLGVKSFNGILRGLKTIISSSSNRKYIYAYWGTYDALCHHHGKNSRKAGQHLKDIDASLKTFIPKLKGTNTLLLITADHGLIDCGKKKVIYLKKHATLKECLSRPVCGEPRAAFCSVHPQKKQLFEKYFKHQLGRYCALHRAEDLVTQGYFGIGKVHPRLLSRLGDYVLIPNDDYIIGDTTDKEFVGQHGGLSKEEMIVPLVKVKL